MKKTLFFLILTIAVIACDDNTELDKPVIRYSPIEVVETKTLSASPNELSFEATGPTKSITISSNTSWSISCPEWCSLSAMSGLGNATISITAQANPNKEQRTGNIVITGDGVSSVTIPLTQKPKEDDPQKEPGADDNQPPT